MIFAGMARKQPIVVSYLRFSRPEQMRGDSVRRQMEASEKWARERGLKLDTSLRDDGVSAFRGRNVTDGALATFLDLVKKGRVPKGSVLLIESLDRLSRDQILPALNLFTGLITSGIRVVTLADGQEYDEASVNKNPITLMIPITVLMRANEESTTKSGRVAEAWRKKRERARIDGHLLTARLPSWLKLDKQGKIAPIPERVAIIKEIYQLTAKGQGIVSIQRVLNAKYKGARAAYISRTHIHNVLSTRAVLGELQMGMMAKDGSGRQKDGETVKDYFPPVVTQDLYYRAQASRKTRQRTGGPRSKFIGLLSGLVYSAVDGTKMIVQGKRQRVFVSYAAVNAAPEAAPFHCLPVACMEAATIFRLTTPATFGELLGEDDEAAEVESLLAEVGTLDAQIVEINHQAMKGRMSSGVVTLLNSLDDKRTSKLRRVEEVKAASASKVGLDAQMQRMESAFTEVLTPGSQSLEERAELRTAISYLLDRIDVWTAKDGKWFLVWAMATLSNGREVGYRFACRTVESNVRWEIVVVPNDAPKGDYLFISNEDGEVVVQLLAAESLPTKVAKKLERLSAIPQTSVRITNRTSLDSTRLASTKGA